MELIAIGFGIVFGGVLLYSLVFQVIDLVRMFNE